MLVAGATGATGEAVLTRLASSSRVARIDLLLWQPVTVAMRHVRGVVVHGEHPEHWPLPSADEGVVMFDPPRLFHGREKALCHIVPAQLPAVGHWMHACGVRRLLVVMPHEQGRLPEAIKRGLANVDEQTVASLGFECVVIIRSAQAPGRKSGLGLLPRLAAGMLGVLHYLVPAREKPVNARSVARVAEVALALAPPGIHIAGPELVWEAVQGDAEAEVGRWLCGEVSPGDNAG